MESTINMGEMNDDVPDGTELYHKSEMINSSESRLEDDRLINSLEKRMKILESDKTSSYKDKSKMSLNEILTPRS